MNWLFEDTRWLTRYAESHELYNTPSIKPYHEGAGRLMHLKSPVFADPLFKSSLPAFTWPPPTPSARQEIDRALLPAKNLAALGETIATALEDAGYSEYSFYWVEGGFALVARLERMRADGTPEPSQFRFLAPESREPFDLGRYISQLFFAPEGYYRQIIFVVTDEVFAATGAALDADQAQQLLDEGANRLPRTYEEVAFSENHAVSALVYEFKKNPADRDVETLRPGRLAGAQHLEKAGIRFGAGP